MKNRQIAIIALVGIVLIGAGYTLGVKHVDFSTIFNNPKNAVLPENIDEMKEKVGAQIERLSDDDKKLLAQYIMRHGMQKIFHVDSGSHGPITIGQAIDKQKGFNDERAQKDSDQKALLDKIEGERKDLAKQAESILTVTLVKKEFTKIDYLDKIVLKIGFQNKSDKDIAGVKGVAVFTDIFGDEISHNGVSIAETIPAGKTYVWTGDKDYNQFEHNDVKLASTDTDKIKFEFQPEVILFKDGTKLAMSEK